MRERKTHKTIPADHPLYYCIQMDERIGKVWLRQPTAIRVAQAITEFEVFGVDLDDAGTAEKLAHTRESLELLGVVLSASWASPTHVLETKERDYDDTRDYALDVIEELRDAGWRDPDFHQIMPLIFKEFMSRMVEEKAVEARADFFVPGRGDES